MADIFLSYAREDLRQAEQLASALASAGWSIWWNRTLLPGQNFDEVIQNEIDAAKCVLVLWSVTSVESRWVMYEAQWAADNHKLVPVMVHDGVRLPHRFNALETPDLSGWFDGTSEREFDKLVADLAKRIGKSGELPNKTVTKPLSVDETGPIPSSPPLPQDGFADWADSGSSLEEAPEHVLSGLPKPLYEQVTARALADAKAMFSPYVAASAPPHRSSPVPEASPRASTASPRNKWASPKAPLPLLRVAIRYAVLAGAIAVTAWAGLKLFPLIFGVTSPATPRRRDDSSGETHPVDCSVFAPPKLAVGDAALVQIYLHPPGRAEEAEAGAKLFDSDAEKRGFRSLSMDLASGTRVAVQLDVEGMEVSDDGIDEIRWNNSVVGTSFKVSSSASTTSGKHFGTVRLLVDGVPAGKINFIMELVSALETEVPPEGLGESVHRYHKAFISYASEDRTEVLKRVQTLGALKIKYFQDILDLEPGERWEKELYKQIDDCDLFLLFWSSAARDSKWVYQETLYARQRRIESETEEPDIIPMMIEGPPPPEPWSDFNDLHFNDKLIYLMRPQGAAGASE